MILKGPYQRTRSVAFKGAFYVRVQQGQIVVCKWPRKRGRNLHPTTLDQMQKFAEANRLAKYVAESQQLIAREIIGGTGLLPRDLILSAMYGRLFAFQNENGDWVYSMGAVSDASRAFDILGAIPGSILARSPTLWAPVTPTAQGQALLAGPLGQLPVWGIPTPGVGQWTQLDDHTLPTGLAVGVSYDVAIPGNWQELDCVFIKPDAGAATRLSVRFNGTAGSNYNIRTIAYTDTGPILVQRYTAISAIHLFHTTGASSTNEMLCRLHINQIGGTGTVFLNGQNNMKSNQEALVTATYNNPAALILSELNYRSDVGGGLPVGTRMITRAILQ